MQITSCQGPIGHACNGVEYVKMNCTIIENETRQQYRHQNNPDRGTNTTENATTNITVIRLKKAQDNQY